MSTSRPDETEEMREGWVGGGEMRDEVWGRRDLAEDLFGFSFHFPIQTATQKYQSTAEHLNVGPTWTHKHKRAHTHSDNHRQIESNKLLLEEIYE